MNVKLLIIEDTESVAQLLAMELKQAGFETRVAADAMIGMQQSVSWRPDVIILDLMLPAGGGVSVLKRLKGSTLTQQIPVIVLTGSTDPQLKKSILPFGVKTFLQKPHDREELIAEIKRLLPPENPAN